jgi:hypothetical protein
MDKLRDIKYGVEGGKYLTDNGEVLLCVKSELIYQCFGCYFEGPNGYPKPSCDGKCPKEYRFVKQ